MALSLPNNPLILQFQSKPCPPSLIGPVKKMNNAAAVEGRRRLGLGLEVSCRKKGIHPKFYEDAKVYCNGELVMTTGGTQKEYVVDVWSGNHPFYLGSRSANVVDADQVAKFRKKYGDITEWMGVPDLKGEPAPPPSDRKSAPPSSKPEKKK